MKVLIIGNGCREHALGYYLSQDPRVKKLYFALGNAGTAALGENLPISSVDVDSLREWAMHEKPDLTVVGPEAPLCAGIVDLFEIEGLKIFGPNRSAARLEGSKIFSKNLFLKAGIPTAKSRRFNDLKEALEYSRTQPFPQVIKADGLASGKGVIIATHAREAEDAIRSMLQQGVFGDAGRRILIEEFLDGQELSVHAVTDGRAYSILPSAQDHKRVFDNDQGPNTGGMGAYSPSPLFTPELEAVVRSSVFEPLLKAFRDEKIEYKGVLYAGLMITKEGPRVLEFNCRFGDPETQVILPLLDACSH
jgi:phosphoribosylamine--glycine ligase